MAMETVCHYKVALSTHEPGSYCMKISDENLSKCTSDYKR